MKDNRSRPGAGAVTQHGFFRRHRRIFVSLLAVIVLLVGGAGYYAYNLNAKLGNIDRVDVDGLSDRPDPNAGEALNILFLGSDGTRKAGETTIAEDAKSADWPQGKHRSDTIMVAHISADRKHVYLLSIPRDTFTTIYDDDGNPATDDKVNAAFSMYGPGGAISTVENLTDMSMSHLAIMDWDGFQGLSSAVGGVRVFIPQDSYDEAQDIEWTKGWHDLEGKDALSYVRTRHGLPNGDFDRIARQQNFMRSLMKKTLAAGSARNPVKLNKTVDALTTNLTVDSSWSNGDLRGLAMSLRHLRDNDVTFLSLPVAGTQADPQSGDIVNIDREQTADLVDALHNDTVDEYVASHPDAKLADPNDVS